MRHLGCWPTSVRATVPASMSSSPPLEDSTRAIAVRVNAAWSLVSSPTNLKSSRKIAGGGGGGGGVGGGFVATMGSVAKAVAARNTAASDDNRRNPPIPSNKHPHLLGDVKNGPALLIFEP